MKLKIISSLIAINLLAQVAYAEDELRFDPQFLNGAGEDIADLTWINTSNTLPPGAYSINVFINNQFAFSDSVTFIFEKAHDGGQTIPCLTPAQITALGVDISQTKGTTLPLVKRCYPVSSLLPDSQVIFEQNKLTLYFSIPQRYMQNLPRGYVNPQNWERGIPSAWFNYVINGSKHHLNSESQKPQDQLFISLNSGINIGAWRLRDYTTWTKENNELTHVQTWLQRDIPTLRSQLYVGETYTPAQIFDSVGLRGVALRTDDNMLPASLRGYAPEVRGIARSNATVTVRQNNNIIYQTNVSPGEFALRDLYPTSSGGDLAVTVEESDGSKSEYRVPFASVPNLVRAGQFKYALSAGKLRPGNNQQTTPLMQSELFWGWQYGLTFYHGLQWSENYAALALGVGQNLGSLGAYSIDITHARSVLADANRYAGDSLRLRYSKLINDAGTRLNFYSWRYSTEGFYSLSDTTYKRMKGNTAVEGNEASETITSHSDLAYDLRKTRKAKHQLLLSQPVGQFGSLSLSWDRQTYWNTSATNQGLQLSWNNTFRNFSTGLSLQRSTSLNNNKQDDIISLSVSLPLGRPALATRARYSMTHANSSGSSHSTGLSGYLPGQDNLFYSITQRYGQKQQYGGDATLRYRGQQGDYALGYGYGNNSRTLSYGMSGGAVLHEDGLTLSQPLGNTNILVKAPGASSVAVRNHKGIKTDSRGYAVIPYATPYRINRVELDVTTTGNEVEIDNALVNKIPNEGALVRATIRTRIGAKAMFIINHRNKQPPFGAFVTADDEKSTGIVGDGGSLYLSGLAQQGTLRIVWGVGSDKTCRASYRLDKRHYNKQTGLYTQELKCE